MRDKIWEKAEENGKYLLNKLKQKLQDNPNVVDIRGKGMEIGVEFVKENGLVVKAVEKAFESGLHLTSDTESIIQIMPPLTITTELMDEGVKILVQACSSFS